jgi:hypothetical protein
LLPLGSCLQNQNKPKNTNQKDADKIATLN